MNKYLLAFLLGTAMAAEASAEVKVTAVPVGEKPLIQPMKAQSTAEILVYENFDKWDAGSVDDPEIDNPLTSLDNQDIDPEIMSEGKQWTGWKCYSAGGTCALRTLDPAGQARINTPKGDYSGSVKVSFLAKYLDVSWEDEEGITRHYGASSIYVGLYTDDNKKFEVGEEDGKPNVLGDVRIYPQYGWYEVTVEFDNFSSYNDAFISFLTPNGVILDDIKVTSSVDKFIAAPIITGVRDVTETSFTVDFEPVRKSYNYYAYLYVVNGYDEETGEPIYIEVPPVDLQEDFTSQGITSYEEMWEYMGYSGEYSDYRNYGTVERKDPRSFTYEGLDPNTDYYYAVASHYIHKFTKTDIRPLKEIGAPVATDATSITKDSFTANWNPIAKADSYQVTLWGVNKVKEDNDSFIIFEEDFDNTSNYTDKTDINNPDKFDTESGLTLDDLTLNPGWETNLSHTLLVQGMIGSDGWNYWLYTPELYVAGADKIIVNMNARFISEDGSFHVKFADVQYQVAFTDGVFEGEFEIPTNGITNGKLQIKGPAQEEIFIDHITLMQPLKKGDLTYTFLGNNVTDATEYSFTGLDTERFDMYGYSVKAIRGEGEAAIFSESIDRIIVDLENGKSMSDITAIEAVGSEDLVETERYTIDGKRIYAPVKGLNIIRMSDGSVRKVFVR